MVRERVADLIGHWKLAPALSTAWCASCVFLATSLTVFGQQPDRGGLREPVYRVARMIHMTRQGLQKIRQSRFGVKVINHFLDKSLWSKRPDLLKSIINKAIQSNDSAWSELALRVFGDYSLWASKERKVEYKPTSSVPPNLDKQLIEQAKLLNMTPKRFRLLWQQNKKKGQAGNSA